MKNATIKIPKNPEKLSSFFCLRWAVLVLIAITGIRYNVGMLANPIFLGRLIDGIESKDSTRKSIGFLLISYVSAILLIQLARALKRYYVRRFAFETIASRHACIFNTLRHKTTKELEKEDIGILSSKRMGDVSKAVEGRRKVTTEIFDTVVLFFVYIVYLFLFDYKITLLSLISIVFAVLASFLFRKIIYKASDKSRKENAILNQLTYDYSDNALLYRIYGRDKKNEENALKLAAQKCKRYGIVPNTNTIRLHKEVYATACPHRSVEIHGGTSGCKTYFINKIREYMGMDKLPDAPVVSGGGSSAASGDPGIVFTYGVMLTDGTILPFVNNLSDFAGLPGRTIAGIAIKVNKGTVKYRVHVKGKGWLPYVTGCNWSDANNGYAGYPGAVIDAVEVYYDTPADIVAKYGYQKAQYRVAPIGGGYYPWQFDNEVGNGQDGYAGCFGIAFDKFQLY